ncbi:MAG: response regulator [Ferruginibacter sp.]
MSPIILIVDDDESVRFFHQVIVRQSELSNNPLCFSSGEEVLTYLDKLSKEDDTYIMLLDINMPTMNCWDLLDAIKDKSYFKQVNVILATSVVSEAEKVKASSYSMVKGIVEKPISGEFCKRIAKIFSVLSNHL